MYTIMIIIITIHNNNTRKLSFGRCRSWTLPLILTRMIILLTTIQMLLLLTSNDTNDNSSTGSSSNNDNSKSNLAVVDTCIS